jgi:hypothetical protein
MQRNTWRQRVWLTLAGLIVILGMPARGDDSAKKESDEAQKKDPVQVREISVTETKDADGNPIEERLIVVDVDPDAPLEQAREALTLALDEAAVAGDPDRTAGILRIEAAPAGDILEVRADGPVAAGQRLATIEDLGKYWIGVQLNPVGPELRAQLNLEDAQGVLVSEVFPDSPAAKAGIKKYDIVLSIGDKKAGEGKDVLEAVKAADGKDVTLKLLRGGSQRTVTVTPSERPKEQLARQSVDRAEVLRDLLEGRRVNVPLDLLRANPEMRLRVVKPSGGLVVTPPEIPAYPHAPAGRGILARLPDDMSITVTREGSKPAKISIKQKERDIETTEDKLNEVPEDLRRYVLPMVGRSPLAAMNLRSGSSRLTAPARPGEPADMLFPAPARGEERRVRVRSFPSGGPADVEHRIDQLQRTLDELRKEIRATKEPAG